MTLRIRNEVFVEGDIGDAAKQITMEPHPDNPADSYWTIDASTFTNGIIPNAFCSIRGAEVKNSTGNGITSWSGSGQAFAVRESYVHDVGGWGIYGLSTGVCQRNIIMDTVGWGIQQFGGSGTIRNCLVVRASGYGIWCQTNHPGSQTRVYYCTVDGTTAGAGGPGTGIFEGSNSLVPRNCISTNNVANGFDLANVGSATYCVAFGNGTDYGAGDQGIFSIVADPLYVAPGLDDFQLQSGSPAIGRAFDTGLAEDLIGLPRPNPITANFDTGAYQFWDTDCGISSVTKTGDAAATVNFVDEGGSPQPSIGSAQNVTNWALTSDTGIPIALLTSAKVSDYVYDVTTSRDFIPGEVVTFNTDLVETDLLGYCNESEGVLFVALTGAVTPDTEGILQAVTGAMADEVARAVGRPTTVLTSPLGITDTTIGVLSTVEFPSSGELSIKGETITYASKFPVAFLGCTREADNEALYDDGFPDRPPPTEVFYATGDWSMAGKAIHEFTAERCDSDALATLAAAYGYGPPIDQMVLADRKNYFQASHYQGRGAYQAAFDSLQAMFGWAETTGADGSTQTIAGETWLIMNSVVFTPALMDRWIWIQGRTRLCKIRSAEVYAGAGGGTRVLLYDFDGGPIFQAHGLSVGVSQITYAILAFRMELDGTWDSSGLVDTAGILRVWLHIQGEEATFLMPAGAALIADGRPKAGKLMATEATDGYDVDGLKVPLFLLDNYKSKTKQALRDVVPAGVRVVVEQVS